MNAQTKNEIHRRIGFVTALAIAFIFGCGIGAKIEKHKHIEKRVEQIEENRIMIEREMMNTAPGFENP